MQFASRSEKLKTGKKHFYMCFLGIYKVYLVVHFGDHLGHFEAVLMTELENKFS